MTGESNTLRKLGAATLLMTSAVFLSRIIGYLREAFIAARFGATPITDAFYAAFTLPDWLNYLAAGGTLSITLLPIYSAHLARGEEDEANRLLSVVTTFLLGFVGLGVAAGMVFAEPLVGAYLHRLDPVAQAACVRQTRILLPAQLFFFAGALASATLYARGRFAAAALAPLLYNLGIIAGGFLLGGRLGPEALAWGALVGAFLGPFLVPAIDARRHGARLSLRLEPRHAGFREWLLLSLPLMLGVSLVTADDWILRYFAGGNAGAITRLSYAKRLVAVPIAVAGQAVGQASMPFFARLFAEGKREELAAVFARTARAAGVLAALAGAYIAAAAVPITDLLFRRGRFDVADVGPTALYLAIFAAAVPLWALQGLAARAFYAARNTLLPMLAGTAVTVAVLPVYALLFRLWGVAGLAAASSVGILLHALVLVALAPRLLPELVPLARGALGGLGRGALLAVVAAAAAFGAVRLVAHAGLSGRSVVVAAIAASAAAFGAVVLGLGRILGVDEPLAVLRALTRRRAAR